MFRSTPPREGRPYRAPSPAVARGFDPRPHARGDAIPPKPSRRPNSFDPRPHARGDVDQHQMIAGCHGFDPRPHARGDNQIVRPPGSDRVSIHAPTRGATPRCGSMRWNLNSFDPRPHARGDFAGLRSLGRRPSFRSTPPREGRRASIARTIVWNMFRSTPPREGRLWYVDDDNIYYLFRSTPPREGRPTLPTRWRTR